MSKRSNIGDIVKSKRKEKGYSQEKLAELCELDRNYIGMIERGIRTPTISVVYSISKSLDFELSNFIKDFHLYEEESNDATDLVDEYIINPNLNTVDLDGETVITTEELLEAILLTNYNIKKIHNLSLESNVDIFDVLGLRNLSGFVGEFLVSSLEQATGSNLTKNPHQDGYPDLLLTNSSEKVSHFESLVQRVDDRVYLNSKEHFSPFKYGGVEIKATCGSTPAASKVPKPLIGEQRIDLLVQFDWKAHHRDTNNLIGILWDFIDEVPKICAVFYSNQLSEDDWGKIVQPRKGGGRTTSVSIMSAAGVRKMCQNWIAVIDDSKYIDKLSDKKWIGYTIA